ncbi:MAG: 30S ribosomal protein S9 [Leptospiraceae bacterium]|nr:30S ribosomal protein S9 [Leptospiraceae bacterium]
MLKPKSTWTVGRRKTSVARVRMSDGSGKIIVNHLDIKDYIKSSESRVSEATAPLTILNAESKYDFLINVKGGGPSGQIGAIRHGIARALSKTSPEAKSTMKKEGFLTRDPRMVERKKYGRHKARRGTQFSKR